jgi:hypothetical protein
LFQFSFDSIQVHVGFHFIDSKRWLVDAAGKLVSILQAGHVHRYKTECPFVVWRDIASSLTTGLCDSTRRLQFSEINRRLTLGVHKV